MNAISSDLHELRRLVVTLAAHELGMKPEHLDPDTPWTQYGLDSLSALVVAGDLEDALCVELSSTLLWDCRTVSELAISLQRVLRERDALAQLSSGVVASTPALSSAPLAAGGGFQSP